MGPRHVRTTGREMTFPLHPRLERIWNGEAGKGEQAERLRRAMPGLPSRIWKGRGLTRSAAPTLQAGGHLTGSIPKPRKSGFSSFCGWTHGVHTVSGQVFRALVNRVEGLSPGLFRLSS